MSPKSLLGEILEHVHTKSMVGLQNSAGLLFNWVLSEIGVYAFES